MKKLVSLVIVLILAMCMATTAFAATGAVIYDPTVAKTVTVPAGETANVTIYRGGVDLVISGEGAFTVNYNGQNLAAVAGKVTITNIQANPRMPGYFTITNNSAAEVTYSIIGQFPLGSRSNPATVEMGTNVAQIEAGNQEGYFFTWTAEMCGNLTITMADGDWMFVVNNITAGKYGENHVSVDDVKSETVAVKPGDQIEVVVSTFDPADSWNIPAGTVTFTASFDEAHTNTVHFDAVEAGCHSNGNIEYWFCPDCEGFWQNEALTQVTNSKNIILPATGSENLQHFDAVEPGCHSNGNIEYWFCPDCEGFWQNEALTQVTNSKNIILPATGSENVIHFDAVEPGCHYNGNIEYWFCPDCEGFWQNEALTQLTNSKNVILPAVGGDVKHVEATEAVCHRPGNIEYWYCEECEQYWQNEALTQLTNVKRVKIAAEITLEYHEQVDATCDKNGMEEYWYCKECDCYFTDAEGIFNIASKRLTIVATGHDYKDGKCTVCGDTNSATGGNNPATGDAGIVGAVVTLLASAMSTVALVAKKKEF